MLYTSYITKKSNVNHIHIFYSLTTLLSVTPSYNFKNQECKISRIKIVVSLIKCLTVIISSISIIILEVIFEPTASNTVIQVLLNTLIIILSIFMGPISCWTNRYLWFKLLKFTTANRTYESSKDNAVYLLYEFTIEFFITAFVLYYSL